MPSADTQALKQTPTRLVALLCAVVIAAASVMVTVQPAEAQDVTARIASIRSAQASAQRSMRALDNQVARYTAQRKAAIKARKQAQRARESVRKSLELAKSGLASRQARLAKVEGLYPNPRDGSESYRARLKAVRKEVRLAEARRAGAFNRMQAQSRVIWAKKAAVASATRALNAAKARRSGAEGTLSSLIKQMTALARVKAEQQATVELTAGSDAFSWPTTGRISQGYGCTPVKFYAKRRGCHWHDGIDVVSASGTPVRAVAVGVVAYSGWNPYDKEGRAYVVDVVHPNGFVSRYGHLLPTNHVRAGELVHTGQVIGKMGNTGFSTGTHLHFELLLNGRDVNPMTYLPSGIVVDKTTTRAGQAAKTRATKQKAKKAAKAKATPTPKPTPPPKPSKTLKYPTATWEEYQAFELCPDLPKGETCDPTKLLARLEGSSGGAPGVPRPYRSTARATS